MQAAFDLRDVGYRNILDISSLIIPAGSFYIINGKSGAGKTTLLRLLNNLITCDRGMILYRGRDILSLDPVALRRSIVMVPQAPFIFPGSVCANMQAAFHFSLKKPPAEEVFERQLSFFGMAGFLKRDAMSLSGGEKQRLALVRALLLDPEVLLLDEPTAALDDDAAKSAMQVLKRWTEGGRKTLVAVTHVLDQANRFAGGVFTMERGRPAGTCEREASGNE